MRLLFNVAQRSQQFEWRENIKEPPPPWAAKGGRVGGRQTKKNNRLGGGFDRCLEYTERTWKGQDEGAAAGR